MYIEKVTNENKEKFLDYCRKHYHEVDESYLSEEDLADFSVDGEAPAFILLEENVVIGAVSLVFSDYMKRAKQIRFRIFHSEKKELSTYSLLLNTVLPYVEGMKSVFIFVNSKNKLDCQLYEELQFIIERTACVYVRDSLPIEEPNFREGLTVRPFVFGQDEDVWCEVRNDAFSRLKGHETPIIPDSLKFLREEEDYVEGGLMMVYDDENPIGIVRVTKDFDNGEWHSFLSTMCVKYVYHRQGIGRALLRYAMRYGAEHGMTKSMLSVDGANHSAISLYKSEGFTEYYTMICYRLEMI